FFFWLSAVFNQALKPLSSRFRIYRETLSRFSCAASNNQYEKLLASLCVKYNMSHIASDKKQVRKKEGRCYQLRGYTKRN
ncbi:hypothetical protein ACO1EF_00590, partial [Bacillus cereus]